MIDNFQEALRTLKKLETGESPTAKTAENKITNHNTSLSLREAPEKSETGKRRTAKTAEITRCCNQSDRLGLVASWSREFGFVSLHDPTTGEWHDLPTKEAPAWALDEARLRKQLYRNGNKRAYRLTSRQIGELWREEHPPETDYGIVEDYPPEEDL